MSGRPPLPRDAAGYSEREREVLKLLAKGYRLPEVAEFLRFSRFTLAENLKHLFKRTGCSTQAEAVYLAVKTGVIE